MLTGSTAVWRWRPTEQDRGVVWETCRTVWEVRENLGL